MVSQVDVEMEVIDEVEGDEVIGKLLFLSTIVESVRYIFLVVTSLTPNCMTNLVDFFLCITSVR